MDPSTGTGKERDWLVTLLLDHRVFPADLPATTYHEQWEVETALDEVTVHQWAHPWPRRRKHPREVVQER